MAEKKTSFHLRDLAPLKEGQTLLAAIDGTAQREVPLVFLQGGKARYGGRVSFPARGEPPWGDGFYLVREARENPKGNVYFLRLEPATPEAVQEVLLSSAKGRGTLRTPHGSRLEEVLPQLAGEAVWEAHLPGGKRFALLLAGREVEGDWVFPVRAPGPLGVSFYRIPREGLVVVAGGTLPGGNRGEALLRLLYEGEGRFALEGKEARPLGPEEALALGYRLVDEVEIRYVEPSSLRLAPQEIGLRSQTFTLEAPRSLPFRFRQPGLGERELEVPLAQEIHLSTPLVLPANVGEWRPVGEARLSEVEFLRGLDAASGRRPHASIEQTFVVLEHRESGERQQIPKEVWVEALERFGERKDSEVDLEAS